MLVNLEAFGRLGNRLFLGAHLIAFCKKYELSLLNLGFGAYAQEFPWFDGNHSCAYPWRATGGQREAKTQLRKCQFLDLLPWSRRFRYWGSENWDYDARNNEVLTAPLSRGQTVLFRSWLFRGMESVQRFKSEILDIYRPRQELLSEVEKSVAVWRRDDPVLVGVHVRWEDYRGTDQFIDQRGFVEAMVCTKALWPSRKVRFVLFSNETLPEDGWTGLDWVRSPGESPLFDLTAMAQCDYLMGPPSTFSGWASFSGSVPLHWLQAHQFPDSLNQFSVVQG